MKYRGVDISLKDGFEIDYDDYLETYNNYNRVFR